MHRLADGVRNLFHTGFLLVTANRVRNLLRSLLLDHFADLVGAGLGASLGNHLANFVGAGLGASLGNHLAHGVRHLLFDNLTLVANAIDRLRLNFGYPDLLAHLTWRALNTDNLAFARAVNASALARIPFPATWLSNALFNHATRTLRNLRFPVPTANLHFFGVVLSLIHISEPTRP